MVVLHPLDTLIERSLRDLVEVSTVCQMHHEPERIVALNSVATVVREECLDVIVSEVVKRRHGIYAPSEIEIERQEKLVMDCQFMRCLQILSHDFRCALHLSDQFLVSPDVCLDLRDDLGLEILPVLRHPRPLW